VTRTPVEQRGASSVEILAERVRSVGRAWRAEDEAAARAELQALATEATLLSRMAPLPLGSSRSRRLRIAAESDGLGRIG
jgi:hypothetical protein